MMIALTSRDAESGAKGYITKDEAAKYLLEAILRICQDEGIWISPKASRRMVEDPED
jgi:DNA-binding NarL/FixJ family response regulator